MANQLQNWIVPALGAGSVDKLLNSRIIYFFIFSNLLLSHSSHHSDGETSTASTISASRGYVVLLFIILSFDLCDL
jgi:hypothetical protein